MLNALLRSRALKRAVDVAGAATGLSLLAPVMGGVALGVLRHHGWPVFFTQARPGKDGEIFRLIKFRTMTNERGPDGELLPPAQRLTPFGKWLRSTSLDELPELWNVLRGDMSLVGPRPLLVAYLERYSNEQARRHEVPPGVTGWAQIHGRNEVDWDRRFELDVWYVDHWSNALDLKILLQTVWTVVRREGISPESEAIMPEFEGRAAERI